MKHALVGLAAVLLVATGCHLTSDSKAPPRPTRIQDLAMAPVDLTKGCPKPREHLPRVASGRLPTGAVLVRLCSGWQQAWDEPTDTPLIYPPVDALTQDPDRIVRLANSLPKLASTNGYCAGMGASAVDLWFGYPGGRAAVGHWQIGACQGIEFGGSGPGLRRSQVLVDTFVRALDRQRRHTGARSHLAAPGCSPFMQPGSAYGYRTAPPYTSATYCVRAGRGPWRQAHIPPAVLRMINHQATIPSPDRECPNHRLVVIRARTLVGDLAHVAGTPCEFHTDPSLGSGDTEVRWRPSSKLRRALQRLPLRLAPHQAPPQPPQPTVTPQ
jgi:hypothetical protein